MKEIKPHWERLISVCEQLENGEMTFKYQNSLPVRIVKATGEIGNRDLTRDEEKK